MIAKVFRKAATRTQARHHADRRLRHVHRLPVLQDDSGLVRDHLLPGQKCSLFPDTIR